MNENTIFCRILLQKTKETFKKFCLLHSLDYKDIMQHSWAYLYSRDKAEFQINKCKDLPNGFYWYGSATGKNHAKSEGLYSLMDRIENKTL